MPRAFTCGAQRMSAREQEDAGVGKGEALLPARYCRHRTHMPAALPAAARGGGRSDLKLLVVARGARSVDKHFKVVVAEDDRVVCGQVGPDIWLLQLCADVEEVGVPPHLDGGREARRRARGAFP